MKMQQIKPVYVDVHGREIATVKIHVNNGSDVAFVLDGHFALTSMESAENFFSSLDFEAAGLSSTALLTREIIKTRINMQGKYSLTSNTVITVSVF